MWRKTLLLVNLFFPGLDVMASPLPTMENRVQVVNGGFTMNFSGRIFRPACQFNQGQPIDVDFEKVGIKKVDGIRYAKTVAIKMKCIGGEGKQLKLQLQGIPYGNQPGVLKTDTHNLGISLRDAVSGQPIVLNVFFKATGNTEFSFIAVPMRNDSNQPLTTGYFSATATLVSSYF